MIRYFQPDKVSLKVFVLWFLKNYYKGPAYASPTPSPGYASHSNNSPHVLWHS